MPSPFRGWIEPHRECFGKVFIRMLLGVVRITDKMKILNVRGALAVVVIKIRIFLVKISKVTLPFGLQPYLVNIRESVSRFMPEDHHDFFFGIRTIIPFCDPPQFVICQIERNFHRAGAIDASPRFFAKVKMRKVRNMFLFQFLSQLDEAFAQSVGGTEIELGNLLIQEFLEM